MTRLEHLQQLGEQFSHEGSNWDRHILEDGGEGDRAGVSPVLTVSDVDSAAGGTNDAFSACEPCINAVPSCNSCTAMAHSESVCSDASMRPSTSKPTWATCLKLPGVGREIMAAVRRLSSGWRSLFTILRGAVAVCQGGGNVSDRRAE